MNLSQPICCITLVSSGLREGCSFSFPGKIKGLVLLVEYSDVKFNNYYSTSAYQYFSDLLNKDDFSEYDATGSAVQYFREQSMGQFDPEFVVVGPITLSPQR